MFYTWFKTITLDINLTLKFSDGYRAMYTTLLPLTKGLFYKKTSEHIHVTKYKTQSLVQAGARLALSVLASVKGGADNGSLVAAVNESSDGDSGGS